MAVDQIEMEALRAALNNAARDRRANELREVLERVPPTDAVAVLLALRPTELAAIVAGAGAELVASLLEGVSAATAAGLLVKLSRAQAADVLEEMQPDDATDVVEELEPDQVEAILVEMRASEADAIRDLRAYAPETAGGRMTPSFVALAPDLSVDLALAALRAIAAKVETMYYAYVTDGVGHLLGVLNLRDLVLAPPGTPIAEIMVHDPVRVRAHADQESAARLLTRHGFLALPVVDADDILLGIVTADDAMDVLEAEFSEDYLRLAGTDAAAMERRTPAQVARLRLPWLLGTMGIELCAGLVISHFDDVLKEVILLASFMPVISAVSGNVGLQAAAIVVRGLDTGHVSLQHWGGQVRKELASSFMLSLACGLVLGLVGVMWSQHAGFGVVIGAAMTCSMLTAGLMGTVIPLLSKRLGFDPAATAGPFETAFQDVIGFAVFLWLASVLLQWLR
jgi:magnesium transporter